MSLSLHDFLSTQKDRPGVKLTVGRVGSARKTVTLALPITIGSSPSCDVIINATSLPAVAKILYANSIGQLEAWDAKRNEMVPVTSLKDIGVRVHVGMGVRKPLIGISLVILAAFVTWRLMPPSQARATAPIDGYTQPVELAYGTVFPYFIDATAADRTYAKGVQFTVTLPEESTAKDLRLSLMAEGIDEAAEILVWFNGRKVGELAPDPKCMGEYCEFHMPIGQEATVAGVNKVAFEHRVPSSDYAIKAVQVMAVSPMTFVEGAVAKRKLEAAARAYDERQIAPKNLLRALSEVRELKSLLTTRLGTESMLADTMALEADVVASLTKAREELIFKAQRDVSLGKVPEAIAAYSNLYTLYPDPTSPEAVQIKDALAALGSLKP